MSDDDLERRLARHLQETAQPMPPGVLDAVVARLPATRREGRWSWLPRAAGVSVAAATLVLVLVMVSLRFPLGPAVLPSSSGLQHVAPPGLVWEPRADYVRVPPGANPAPDRYGNPGVWRYEHSSSPYLPSSRRLFEAWDASISKWYSDPFPNLHVYPGNGGLILHPYGSTIDGQAATVTWVSPIAGRVAIRGRFQSVQACAEAIADGVAVSIDADGANLLAHVVPHLGSASIDLEADVETGTRIAFVVRAGANSNCDSTELVLAITSIAP